MVHTFKFVSKKTHKWIKYMKNLCIIIRRSSIDNRENENKCSSTDERVNRRWTSL